MEGPERDKNLGLLVIVGGPGGSGSSTISKELAIKWNLERVYGGKMMREFAGDKSLEQFVKEDLPNSKNFDFKIDNQLIEESKRKNILIESKTFAGLSISKNIPTSVKIWLTADPETSVNRIFEREGWEKEEVKYQKEINSLKERQENDRNRYLKTYNIDIFKPEDYNDIVIDSSVINVEETIAEIISQIKKSPELASRFPDKYIKSNSTVMDEIVQTDPNQDDLQTTWIRLKCTVCGFMYEGKEQLEKCPKCGNDDPDKFEDVD